MSTADKTGRITQALGDRLACLGMSMSESVNASAAEFDDLMVTIDALGPATPETRAEVKSARRAEQRKATKEPVTAYLVMALVAAAFALGSLVGNVTDSDVRDVQIPVPSGERAEPEESAK